MSMEIANKIVMKKISEIKPYVRNARRNDKTVKLLVDIIPKVGFNVPIVVDKNGIIVKGHARYTAAIRLKMDEVPCVVTNADEESIKLDRIADNKISEFSEWVTDELLHEVDMLNTDFDLTSLGFAPAIVDEIAEEFEDMDFEADDVTETEEERAEKYKKFLESYQPKKETITTQAQIERAVAKTMEVTAPPKRYYKVACECCGHIMFIAEGDVHFETQS